MQRTVFYSWQSDLPNATNRGFIQRALEEAVVMLAGDAEVGVEPVVERDTQNVPGAPDIALTILRKVAASDVFVADVSLVTPRSAKRAAPNPNVLIELGYALHALGEDRVILVCNRAFGKVERLPFDLKMRRTLVYEASEDSDRVPERRQLAAALRDAIKLALAAVPVELAPTSSAEASIEAVRTARPDRVLLVRQAVKDAVKSIVEVQPPTFHSGGRIEDFLQALSASCGPMGAFASTAEVVAAVGDGGVAKEFLIGLEPILECYDNPRRFSGHFDLRDFDYFKFVGHELVVLLAGLLIREGQWQVLGDLLDEGISVANVEERGRYGGLVHYTYASKVVECLEPLSRERQRVSVHADLLSERHTKGPLATIVPFDLFMAADCFLFLRGELSPAVVSEPWVAWKPWSTLYLRAPPKFLAAATSTRTAEQVARAMRVPDIATLKQRLLERAGRLDQFWGHAMFWDQPFERRHIDQIGTT
jgi:hypothetical protein